MAFLFKSKTKQHGGGALPPAGRSLTSADGSNAPSTNGFSLHKDSDRSRIAPTPPVGAVPPSMNRGPTPDLYGLHAQDAAAKQASARSTPNTPQRPVPDASLFPWSPRRLDFTTQANPFPRYGAAINAVASPKGDIYLMGGLINGATVRGDLWSIEASHGPLRCMPVPTQAEGPCPRVGHAALLVGNAFIIFGGDTKENETDVLDDTLYLLNTSTKQWSRALPAGSRPAGRYGHTLNILGSKIYIFGGQVESFFFNDLIAFDLNALQMANSRWEILIYNTSDGGPPQGQSPPARTNHTVVTWDEKLFLFGGTDGTRWFNDVWTYDPRTNSWQHLECIGFIPAAREGHSAALVGDVMYIFGGRTEDGTDLGDLAAFRIPTRRWYTFQNMGPSPSPRSGHAMIATGNQILVVGGEPSSAPRDPGELSMSYILDTSKIRYPTDNPGANVNGRARGRTGSLTDRGGTPQERSGSEDKADSGVVSRMRKGSNDSMNLAGRQSPMTRPDLMGSAQQPPGNAPAPIPGQRQIRGPTAPPPQGPPPQGMPPGPPPPQQQTNGPRMNGMARPFAGPDGRESPRQGQRLDRGPGPDQSGVQYSGRSSPTPREQMQAQPQMQLDERATSPPARMPGSFSASNSPPNERLYGQNEQKYGQQSAAKPQSQSQPQSQSSTPKRGNSLQYQAQQRNVPQHLRRQQGSMDTNDRSVPGTPGTDVFRTPMEEPEKVMGGSGMSSQAGQYPVDSGVGSSPAYSQQNQYREQQAQEQQRQHEQEIRQQNQELQQRQQNQEAQQRQHDHQARQQQQRNEALLRDLETAKSSNLWYAQELALAQKAGYMSTTIEQPESDELNVVSDEDRPMMEVLIKMRGELARVQEAFAAHNTQATQHVAHVEKQRDAALAEAMYAKTRSAAHYEDSESRSLDDSSRTDESGRRLAAALAMQDELSVRLRSLTAEIEQERKARQLAEESADVAHSRASELDLHRQETSSELERLRTELHEAQRLGREESANSAEALGSSRMLQVDNSELSTKLASLHEDSKNHHSVLSQLREAVTASSNKAEMLERKLDQERRQRSNIEDKLSQLKSEHEARVSELETTQRRLSDAEEIAASHAAEAQTHRSAVLAGFGKLVPPSDRGLDSNTPDERVSILQEQVDSASAMVRRNQEAANAASEKLRRAEERIAGLEAYQEQTSREGLSMRKQLQTTSREQVALHAEKADLTQQLTAEKMNLTALQVQHTTLRDLLDSHGVDPSHTSSNRLSAQTDPATSDRLRDLETQLDASRRAHEDMRTSFEAREQDAARAWKEKIAALDKDYQAAVEYLKGTERMLSKMKQEQHRYKSQNKDLEEELARERRGEGSASPVRRELNEHQARLAQTSSQLEAQTEELRAAHASVHAAQAELGAARAQQKADIEVLRQRSDAAEERAQEAERKVQMLLETVDSTVAAHRESLSQQTHGHMPPLANGSLPGGGLHSRQQSTNSATSFSLDPAHPQAQNTGGVHPDDGVGGAAGSLNPRISRNSMALDSLASELETLRSHWETTNKNYRSSGQSLMAGPAGQGSFGGGQGGQHLSGVGSMSSGASEGDVGMSEGLTNWRRRLDA